MKNFDNVFAPTVDATAAPPPAVTPNTDPDLNNQPTTREVEVLGEAPTSLTQQECEKAHPTVVASVTVNIGANLTCHVVQDHVLISSSAKITVPGLHLVHEGAFFP